MIQLKKKSAFLPILYVYIVKMVAESLLVDFRLPRSGKKDAVRRLQA
jgi:hypothetical protein